MSGGWFRISNSENVHQHTTESIVRELTGFQEKFESSNSVDLFTNFEASWGLEIRSEFCAALIDISVLISSEFLFDRASAYHKRPTEDYCRNSLNNTEVTYSRTPSSFPK